MRTVRTGLEGLAKRCAVPGHFEQGFRDVLDYEVDWSDRLVDGDTITESLIKADAGITLFNETYTANTTGFWVSGGTPGYLYRVVNTIFTQGGRIIDRKLLFKIVE